MTKAELVEEVSRVSDLTKKHSEVIVDTVFKSIIDALQRGEKIDLQVDSTYPMKVIKLSPGERKIGLSIRALRVDQERTEWQSYTDGGSVGATIGEHLKNLD
jgi:ribosomal protein S1